MPKYRRCCQPYRAGTELLGPGRLPLLHFPGSNASFPASALQAILLQFLLRAFRSSRNFGMKPTGVISGVQPLKQCPNPTIQISCHPKRTWSDNVSDLHEGKNCSVTRTPVPWYRTNLRQYRSNPPKPTRPACVCVPPEAMRPARETICSEECLGRLGQVLSWAQAGGATCPLPKNRSERGSRWIGKGPVRSRGSGSPARVWVGCGACPVTCTAPKHLDPEWRGGVGPSPSGGEMLPRGCSRSGLDRMTACRG